MQPPNHWFGWYFRLVYWLWVSQDLTFVKIVITRNAMKCLKICNKDSFPSLQSLKKRKKERSSISVNFANIGHNEN